MPLPAPPTHDTLAQALLQAVRDALHDAPRFDPPPNLDLAVVAWSARQPDAPPAWANVLFSREFAQGIVADIAPDAGDVRNVRYLADVRDAADPQGTSLAWVAGTDWRQLPASRLVPLQGDGPHRFIAPYPASLIKLMVLVGVAHAVDRGLARWDEPWPHDSAAGALAPTVAQWAEPMIVASSNEATSALVALLHARDLIRREGWVPGQTRSGHEVANDLHTLFAQQGLTTLRLASTKPDGGWFNRDDAGVGQLQMTAWDSVRLLWRLLAGDAPPAPWLPAGAPPLLSAASRQRVWGWLGGQALHEVLSSTLVSGFAGWQAGIPARLPARWLGRDGSVQVGGTHYPGDVRLANAAADAVFAHKTGGTASYASDAGYVQGDGGRRYLIALTSTLGGRHAPHPDLAAPWCVPRIGAAVDHWLRQRLQ
jgi:beta-lactamase class A